MFSEGKWDMFEKGLDGKLCRVLAVSCRRESFPGPLVRNLGFEGAAL